MKLIIYMMATLAIIASAGDDRIKVDLYSESLWPGCEDVISNSFSKALNA